MTIKELFKTTNIKQEPEGCFLVSTVTLFSCQKFCHKIPKELPIHVHFRWPYLGKEMLFFSWIQFQIHIHARIWSVRCTIVPNCSAHVHREKKPMFGDTCPWSDVFSNKCLYEVTTQLTDDKWEDKMNTNELPATSLQPSRCRCTTHVAQWKVHLNHYKTTYTFTSLETRL